jgi:hypothetical protein
MLESQKRGLQLIGPFHYDSNVGDVVVRRIRNLK